MKSSPGSDSKNHKHKKSKIFTSNGNGVGEVDTEGPIKVIDMIMVDLNSSKHDRDDKVILDNGDGLNLENDDSRVTPRDKISESLDSIGKKRGRIKQKKLPLSICSFRDQTSPKEGLKSPGMPLSEDTNRTAAGNRPLSSAGTSGNSLMPVERTSMWKCQEFRAPACVSQNKVMQS
ncbi:hypothetical protein DH2020_009915 [Rehmannia glutinosa]|uniref:Uncharacterized protein n=1 Tax=Rehmannia glutinosa TaxID=99300 RepID=A0ABR0X9Q5_REHGL